MRPRFGAREVRFGAIRRRLKRRRVDGEERLPCRYPRAFEVRPLQQDTGHPCAHFHFARTRGLRDVLVGHRHGLRLDRDDRDFGGRQPPLPGGAACGVQAERPAMAANSNTVRQ